MAERLSGGNEALALLGNTLPTGAILVVLILVFGPISGAHFNPAVTLVFLIRKEITTRLASFYVVAQVIGGLTGVVVAHLMFELPAVQFGTHERSGAGQWLAEAVATAGLVMTVLGCRKNAVPFAVGLYITAAYWFTASTSFANPAVTIARSLTETFSGIRPEDVFAFIPVQLVSACGTALVWRWLTGGKSNAVQPVGNSVT
jgi:glycerol uptake facilitator-like aquaporin